MLQTPPNLQEQWQLTYELTPEQAAALGFCTLKEDCVEPDRLSLTKQWARNKPPAFPVSDWVNLVALVVDAGLEPPADIETWENLRDAARSLSGEDVSAPAPRLLQTLGRFFAAQRQYPGARRATLWRRSVEMTEQLPGPESVFDFEVTRRLFTQIYGTPSIAQNQALVKIADAYSAAELAYAFGQVHNKAKRGETPSLAYVRAILKNHARPAPVKVGVAQSEISGVWTWDTPSPVHDTHCARCNDVGSIVRTIAWETELVPCPVCGGSAGRASGIQHRISRVRDKLQRLGVTASDSTARVPQCIQDWEAAVRAGRGIHSVPPFLWVWGDTEYTVSVPAVQVEARTATSVAQSVRFTPEYERLIALLLNAPLLAVSGLTRNLLRSPQQKEFWMRVLRRDIHAPTLISADFPPAYIPDQQLQTKLGQLSHNISGG